MIEKTPTAGAVHSEQGIGSRPRRPAESTYGFPNHEDGIQSGNLNDDDKPKTVPAGEATRLGSGPGATDSNGMSGQKS